MDERNRQINELEQRKREQIVFLDELLIRLGEALLCRTDGSFQEQGAVFDELVVYRRLQHDIADSETSIQAVEEQIRRFRELEETIETKEQAESACAKELAIVYGRLGKALLDESAPGENYAEFCAPYREHADALVTKVISLEERLAGLEEKDGGNVFTWIGKGAQGLVLRSFLTKAQENLEQLRRNVGERYSRRDTGRLLSDTTDGGVEQGLSAALCAEIEQKRAETRICQDELTELRDERRTISNSFNAEGGPLKQIQTLKNHITHKKDELKALYRRIGAEAASIGFTGRRIAIDSLLLPEDGEALDSAARISRQIHDHETAIQRLQASLAIDEEKVKIDKYRKMIQEKRDKIAQAEKNITEFEERIRVSESTIEKLQGDTHGN